MASRVRSISRHLVAALALVAAAAIVAPRSARAQSASSPSSLVVFTLEGSDDTADLREELTTVIREEAGRNQRYRLVNDNPILLSDTVVVLGCQSVSTACLGKAAKHFDADYLIFGKLEETGGRTRVSVRLFDPRKGRYVESFGRVITKMTKPYDTFRQKVGELLGPDSGVADTVVQVRSNVDGATVKIDGTVAGTTPLDQEGVAPGPHQIRVEADGREPWTTHIDLAESESVEVRATLRRSGAGGGGQAAGGVPPGSADGPSNKGADHRYSAASRYGPWIAIGAGALAFGGAGFADAQRLQAMDDLRTYRRENQDNTKRCETEKECNIIERGENAETTLRVLIGVGGVSVASGLLWLWFRTLGTNGSQQKAAVRRLQFSATGRGVSVGWRW